MYSLIPTAVRGRSSSTAEPYALGRGIQHAEEVPARPRAGAPILASLDGVESCHGATNHKDGQFGAGDTLVCVIPTWNPRPPLLKRAPRLRELWRTVWSIVAEDRLGRGELFDCLALDVLVALPGQLLLMLGAVEGAPCSEPCKKREGVMCARDGNG